MKPHPNEKLSDNATPYAGTSQTVPTGTATSTKPELSNGVIVVFVALQLLDIITTLLGLGAGAHEANFTVAWLMQLGPGAGLLVAKFLGYLILVVAVATGRTRVIRKLNFLFAGIVTWNLVVLWIQRLGTAGQ